MGVEQGWSWEEYGWIEVGVEQGWSWEAHDWTYVGVGQWLIRKVQNILITSPLIFQTQGILKAAKIDKSRRYFQIYSMGPLQILAPANRSFDFSQMIGNETQKVNSLKRDCGTHIKDNIGLLHSK